MSSTQAFLTWEGGAGHTPITVTAGISPSIREEVQRGLKCRVQDFRELGLLITKRKTFKSYFPLKPTWTLRKKEEEPFEGRGRKGLSEELRRRPTLHRPYPWEREKDRNGVVLRRGKSTSRTTSPGGSNIALLIFGNRGRRLDEDQEEVSRGGEVGLQCGEKNILFGMLIGGKKERR